VNQDLLTADPEVQIVLLLQKISTYDMVAAVNNGQFGWEVIKRK